MRLVDNVREFLDKKSKLLAVEFYTNTLSRLKEMEEECGYDIESPIEHLFLIEWMFKQFSQEYFDVLDINPQYKEKSTGKFRLDFSIEFIQRAYIIFSGRSWDNVIMSLEPPKLGIELDSHIWHEKTKEQAQKDKERERFLISNGWKLIRFTGTEVYNDTPKCVQETLDFAEPMRDEYLNQIRKKHKESNPI